MDMSFDDRGDRFRDSFAYIRALADDYPTFEGAQGTLNG